MQWSYFPDPLLCWVYLLLLLGLLSVASWFDVRSFTIPKGVTLTTLGLGLVINVVRGAWLGEAGSDVFLIAEPGPALGGVDGLLFALAGFFLGFAVFFGLWMLGTCGGGDVKLFAALGAWVGPRVLVYVFVVTVVLVFFLAIGRFAWRVATGQKIKFEKPKPRTHAGRRRGQPVPQPRHRALGFALPLAVACVLVLPWVFRFDLRLMDRPEKGLAAAPAVPQR